ncbi:mitotic-spindle organizing gamma-tubulin ring associated-domain-containing protein [Phyllosticta citribraziliensis]|uniref:Mitotic-spindle organizing protein 1 n=1 Tax=Phyllosticta citribraziliensis TaxID=989973 RepID=A0ABR1LSM3_9PEZI
MPPQATTDADKRQAAREVVDILEEIATLLNTKLNRTQLSYCISLIENGVNPEALATVIRDLRTQYPEPLDAVGDDDHQQQRQEQGGAGPA